MPDPTDESLMEEIAAGGAASLKTLYERHASMLMGLAVRILHDSRLAEEVLQDVFVRVWNKAQSFDPTRAKALAWVVLMVRSRAIDLQRARETRAKAVEQVSSEPIFAPQGPDEQAVASEESQKVRAALTSLPSEQQEAINLAFFSGLSHSQIAAQLGQSLGTVKTRIRSGMLRLRAALKSREGQS